jgi:hypothetical protein
VPITLSGWKSAAEGMADDDRPVDALLLHQPGDRSGLSVRGGIFGAAPFGITMAGTVNEQKLGATAQRCQEGRLLVAQIAARAMDEDDRRQIRDGPGRYVQRVHAETADIRQGADIGVTALDLGCPPGGETEGAGKSCRENEEKNDHVRQDLKPQVRLPASFSESFSMFSWAVRSAG